MSAYQQTFTVSGDLYGRDLDEVGKVVTSKICLQKMINAIRFNTYTATMGTVIIPTLPDDAILSKVIEVYNHAAFDPNKQFLSLKDRVALIYNKVVDDGTRYLVKHVNDREKYLNFLKSPNPVRNYDPTSNNVKGTGSVDLTNHFK